MVERAAQPRVTHPNTRLHGEENEQTDRLCAHCIWVGKAIQLPKKKKRKKKSNTNTQEHRQYMEEKIQIVNKWQTFQQSQESRHEMGIKTKHSLHL